MVQYVGSRIAKVGEKKYKKADTFVTPKNAVLNVVSENSIFNVLLWYHFIDNCFTCAGHAEEAYVSELVQARSSWIKSIHIQEPKVEK